MYEEGVVCSITCTHTHTEICPAKKGTHTRHTHLLCPNRVIFLSHTLFNNLQAICLSETVRGRALPVKFDEIFDNVASFI